jgi:hypothetical protein
VLNLFHAIARKPGNQGGYMISLDGRVSANYIQLPLSKGGKVVSIHVRSHVIMFIPRASRDRRCTPYMEYVATGTN